MGEGGASFSRVPSILEIPVFWDKHSISCRRAGLRLQDKLCVTKMAELEKRSPLVPRGLSLDPRYQAWTFLCH